ncbi:MULTISPECIES: hypothetical protein [unclassified Pseudomonas]|uniref:hypothetical protein n=1 Tax=unclassified Pseudomonas TaxID=196821 RepID=UPI0006D3CD1E|nr:MULTISPECIES: hypothetical protein [unclassified Pseudomonas]
MSSIHCIQHLQLRLIESASVNESCATDLLLILRKLTSAEANSVNVISLLHSEADALRSLSIGITQRYAHRAELLTVNHQ